MNKFLVSLAAFALASTSALAGNPTQITWYGHAAFKVVTPSGKVIFLDPWLTNPANKNGKDDLAKTDKADLVLVTHGHADHVGDAAEIGKKTGAKLVGTFDLGNALVKHGGYPEKQAGMDTLGNSGGELTLLDGDVTVVLVPAVHSSTVTDAQGLAHPGGNPGGFILKIKDGPTVYHTGDTDAFGDMAMIGKMYKVDVMLACIGGHFTMDPARAAEAAAMVKPKTIIPMHFGTFPLLAGTPDALGKALSARKVPSKVQALEVGATAKF